MTAPTHWTIAGASLSRTFITENYDASFELANEIKEVADDINHHPDMLITYNTVVVSTTTHDKGTLTDLDYELAESINDIYDELEDDYSEFDEDEEDEEPDDDTDLDIPDEDIF